MSIGRSIKQKRVQAGLTQKELAQMLSLSQAAIAMYERDEREPNSDTLIALANIFNCTVGTFFDIGTDVSIFAQRLRIAINNKGINQSILAYRSGVDRSTISNYLNGRYKAKSEMLYKMADVLCVSPAWLDGFDVPMHSETLPYHAMREEEAKFLDLFKKTPDEYKDLILQMMLALIGEKQ